MSIDRRSEATQPLPEPRASDAEPPSAGSPVADTLIADAPSADTPAVDAVDRSLPPDPAAYDSPRAGLARARGLSAPYIAGGRDPIPESGLHEERFYGRLLVIMVVVIVLSGFVLGLLGNVIAALGGG